MRHAGPAQTGHVTDWLIRTRTVASPSAAALRLLPISVLPFAVVFATEPATFQ